MWERKAVAVVSADVIAIVVAAIVVFAADDVTVVTAVATVHQCVIAQIHRPRCDEARVSVLVLRGEARGKRSNVRRGRERRIRR